MQKITMDEVRVGDKVRLERTERSSGPDTEWSTFVHEFVVKWVNQNSLISTGKVGYTAYGYEIFLLERPDPVDELTRIGFDAYWKSFGETNASFEDGVVRPAWFAQTKAILARLAELPEGTVKQLLEDYKA